LAVINVDSDSDPSRCNFTDDAALGEEFWRMPISPVGDDLEESCCGRVDERWDAGLECGRRMLLLGIFGRRALQKAALIVIFIIVIVSHIVGWQCSFRFIFYAADGADGADDDSGASLVIE
jgi:hypothetical protein